MQHDFSIVFDTDNEYWNRVLEIFVKNEKYPKKVVSNRNLHHKFPRSFSKMLGEPVDNEQDNLISLTLADHFLVHYYYYLLARKGYRQRMATAFTFMAKKGLKFMTPATAEQMALDYEEAVVIANQYKSDTMEGHQFTDETKKKISEAHKGKKLTDEHKQHIGEARIGTKLSEETKIKISQSGKGRIVTEETRLKMSKAKKGQNKGRTWKVINGHRQWV